MATQLLGIDIGGTKVEGAVLDDGGAVRARRRVAAPGRYEDLLGALVDLVGGLEAEVGARCSVGVCTPGTRSPRTGRMKNAQHTPLEGRAFDADLGAALGREVRVANDAHCFALSEAVDGAGAGASSLFGVILGTGVGGGVVLGGRLHAGASGASGEWAHVPLPWVDEGECPGPRCACGKFGCIEAFLSGPGMSRDHERHTGQRLPSEAIVARAPDDEGCGATLRRYVDRLARALAAVVNLLDPEVVVLGGGLSRVGALYELVPARWGRYLLSGESEVRLVPARHGDASGVRGAARLWSAHDTRSSRV